ncbi:hypothetical protein BJ742DRAFT_771950 [Cladochytrium replicatum]|nr:hypothetical protein BJ742DRAFT_771950 [Cladochytrium replicatum]
MRLIFVAGVLLALSMTVYAHSAIMAVNGANGCTCTALGINLETPPNRSRRRSFKQDTARTRSGGCGHTLELENSTSPRDKDAYTLFDHRKFA